MKKLLTLIVAVLIVSTTIAQTTLSLNLVKGKEYRQLSQGTMKMTQEVGGQKMEIEIVMKGGMVFLVKNVNPTSYDMDVWYENISMEMKMPQGEMKYSSENATEGDIISQVFSGMIKKPFQAQISKTGKVNSVKNIEAIYESAFAKFPNISPEQKAQVISQVSQSFGDKSFASNIEMVTAIFPDKAVKVGETWNVKTQLQGAMRADINTTFKYVSDGQGFKNIHGDAKITTPADADYAVSNGMEMKFNISGTMTSDIKIDKATGWVLEAKTTQNMSGDSHIKGNAQMPDGLTIPMTILSLTTITGSL